MISTLKDQHGFTLVSAIFLLVALALLGLYMVTIGGVQRATTTRAIVAERVFLGAKTGLEWAIHRAVNTQKIAGIVVPLACTPSTSFTLTDAALRDIAVTVSCTYTEHKEGGATNDPFKVYYLTSTASYSSFGSPDYVQRRLDATVSNRYGPKEP